MKLKTSFFNGTVLKKDITRFMPVWAIYTIGLVMFQMLRMGTDSEPIYRACNMASYQIHSMAVVTFLYAGSCAVTLFGDLYVPRMCNALHAMPMRREGWFLTHTVAGLLFGLIPNLLAALVTVPMLESYYYVAFLWLGGVMLQYVFFFGLALLCVMCAGSRLGMVACYAIANFFSMFIYGLVNTFYIPLLYGVVLNSKPLELLCPVWQITSSPLIETVYPYPTSGPVIDSFVSSAWNYLFVLAGLGVVFAVAAMLLYRRRQLERAGDFLALPALSPVFLLIITLGNGMIFYLFASLFGTSTGSSYPFLFVGMAVGYFVGRMLLERSVKVFRPKSVLGFVVVCVLMGASLGVTRLDPLNLVTRVPVEDQIESCSLDDQVWDSRHKFTSDPMEIHKIVELHEQLCREQPTQEGDTTYNSGFNTVQINIVYSLTDGSRMERSYPVTTRTEAGRQVAEYLSSWQNLLGCDDLSELAPKIHGPRFVLWNENYNAVEYELPREELMPLLEAIKADSEEGTLVTSRFLNETTAVVANIDMYVEEPEANPDDSTEWIRVDVNEKCVHTMEILRRIAEVQPPITY